MAALVTLSLLALFIVGRFGLTALLATPAPDGLVRENFSGVVEREMAPARGNFPARIELAPTRYLARYADLTI